MWGYIFIPFYVPCASVYCSYRYNNTRKCDISNEILHTCICGVWEGLSLQKRGGVCKPRSDGGMSFQSAGPTTAKVWCWNREARGPENKQITVIRVFYTLRTVKCILYTTVYAFKSGSASRLTNGKNPPFEL